MAEPTVINATLTDVNIDQLQPHVIIRLDLSNGKSKEVTEYARDTSSEDLVRRYLGGRLPDGSLRAVKLGPLEIKNGKYQIKPYCIRENGKFVRHEVPAA